MVEVVGFCEVLKSFGVEAHFRFDIDLVFCEIVVGKADMGEECVLHEYSPLGVFQVLLVVKFGVGETYLPVL